MAKVSSLPADKSLVQPSSPSRAPAYSIANKLQAIIMLTVAIALSTASLAFLLFPSAALSQGETLLILTFSGLVSFPVARWLQRTVSDPLIHLCQTARAVTLFHDYSLRVRKSGEDEIGALIEAFNDILSAIGKCAEE